jgi:hypothetical protein
MKPPHLSTDTLSELANRLCQPSQSSVRQRLGTCLENLVTHADYQQFIDNEDQPEFACPAPPDLAERGVLAELGLISPQGLLCKVNLHFGRLFLTDGLWVPGSVRVFPFVDESTHVVRYVRESHLDEWADLIVDPASGCGHHALALGRKHGLAAFDTNPRANIYATLNAFLNHRPDLLVGRRDVRNGFSTCLFHGEGRRILFPINMPFAVSPVSKVLPPSADGGRSGAKLTLAANRALKEFANRYRGRHKAKAVILCYSLGTDSLNNWLVVGHARKLFGEENVRWRLLTSEKLWRVNGRKEQNNPMGLDKLALKAECRYYVTDESKRDEMRQGYRRLQAWLQDKGWTVLGYGIVEIDVC